jgi:hypothetical protein
MQDGRGIYLGKDLEEGIQSYCRVLSQNSPERIRWKQEKYPLG